MVSWLGYVAVALLAGPALPAPVGVLGHLTTRYPTGPTDAMTPGATPTPASVEAAEPRGTPSPTWVPRNLGPPTPDVLRPRDGWAWPVPEPHEVVRRFDPPEVKWGSGHRGVDLATAVGGVVRSPADGVVSFVGVVAGQEVVVVAHENGLRSTFQPVLASAPVGARVSKGEPVAVLAATPGHCAPGSCVHWGVLRGDSYLDPLGMLRQPVVLLPLR